jgi:hypothetical protein
MGSERAAQAVVIAIFFGLLAVSAATGFPGEAWGEPLPRGLRVLRSLVALVTDPLGRTGGATLFAGVGLLTTWLAWRGPRRAAAGQGAAAGREDLQALMDVLLQAREPGPVPAWALALRSPYATWDGATSWLGGRPKAPAGFAWPCDEDGTPQLLLAQLDLADLGPRAARGGRAAALPEAGALLVFVGQGCTVRLLTAAEVSKATELPAPPNLPPLKDRGMWGAGWCLGFWPVDPVAYASVDEDTRDEGCPMGLRGHAALGAADGASPEARATWLGLTEHTGGGEGMAGRLRAAPPEVRGAIEVFVGAWRGHRLFGIEPNFENNAEDLRGWSCLLSVASDPLLGTGMEHHSGVSVWFRTADLDAGRLDAGQVVWRVSV